MKEYVTADGEIFKTTLDIGEVNPKLYTLEHLEIAERRVHQGTNKTLQKALNATKALMKKNRKSSKVLSKVSFDEYGINESTYTKEQVKFLKDKIDEYEAIYESATPFERETIGMMASILLKINEVKAKMVSSDEMAYVKQLKDLRDMFSAMASDLKMRPKDKKEVDKSKGRTSLAEIVMRYEARKRSGRRETSERTKQMAKDLAVERVKAIDGNFSDTQ